MPLRGSLQTEGRDGDGEMAIRYRRKPEGRRGLGGWGGGGLMGLVHSFHFRSVSCAGGVSKSNIGKPEAVVGKVGGVP